MVHGYKTELVLYGTTAAERYASLHDWSQPLTQHFIGASFCAFLQRAHHADKAVAELSFRESYVVI
jgi:hypothetical protein